MALRQRPPVAEYWLREFPVAGGKNACLPLMRSSTEAASWSPLCLLNAAVRDSTDADQTPDMRWKRRISPRRIQWQGERDAVNTVNQLEAGFWDLLEAFQT